MSQCLLDIFITIAGTAGAISLLVLPIWLHIKYPHLVVYHPYCIDYSDLLKRPGHEKNDSHTVLDPSKSACRDEQDDSKQSSKG